MEPLLPIVVTPAGQIWNTGVDSRQLGTMVTQAAQVVDPLYSATTTKNVCVIWGGSNDFALGNASVATVYARLQTYCADRRARGWKVVVVTMLPRTNLEVQRVQFNSLVRSNWATFADGIADVALDSRIGDFGDNTDLTYYAPDQIHLNATGYGVAASIIAVPVLVFA